MAICKRRQRKKRTRKKTRLTISDLFKQVSPFMFNCHGADKTKKILKMAPFLSMFTLLDFILYKYWANDSNRHT